METPSSSEGEGWAGVVIPLDWGVDIIANLCLFFFFDLFDHFFQVYSEQDTAKMPLELGTVLSIEREPVLDPEIRVQALEAIYLISLQV